MHTKIRKIRQIRTGILGNLGIFETEVAAMAMAMSLVEGDFGGEYYRLVMCEKFCNFCKCGTGFCAEFARWATGPVAPTH